MGDRATIRIKQSNSDTAIHFYTHRSGSTVNSILAKALSYASVSSSVTRTVQVMLGTTALASNGSTSARNLTFACTIFQVIFLVSSTGVTGQNKTSLMT